MERKLALEILGSTSELEVFFRTYEMHEDLENLLRHSARYSELFQLHLEQGNLERALGVVVDTKSQADTLVNPSANLTKLMDFVLAGRLVQRIKVDDLESSLVNEENHFPLDCEARVKLWDAGAKYLKSVDSSTCSPLVDLEDSTVQTFISIIVSHKQSINALLLH